MGELTLLIERAREGDREAFDRIFELLYPERRQIAHRRPSRGARDGPIETTALVNECYVKFIQRKALTPTDRSHFLAYSATVMRSSIVDAARVARTERRGGDVEQVTLDSELIGTLPAASDEILDVHTAARGSRQHRRTARASGRNALLRWHGRRRDRRGPGPADAHRVPRLGQGSAVAGPRASELTAQAPPG